jgi:hypothetical protein
MAVDSFSGEQAGVLGGPVPGLTYGLGDATAGQARSVISALAESYGRAGSKGSARIDSSDAVDSFFGLKGLPP